MKNLKNVTELFSSSSATKIIATISPDGEPHAIVAGTVVIFDNDTLAFAEVFMKKTSRNLNENGKIAILAEKGAESYLVNATDPKKHTNGEVFDRLSPKFTFLKVPINAVWTCKIDKIFNQGANVDAGIQLF